MATRPGEKTSFALACGLLSQYMKEKGSSLNLNLGMSEAYQRPTTMCLLPGAEVETEPDQTEENANANAFVSVSNRNEMELFLQSLGFKPSNPSSEKKPAKEAEKSQLTIFYGGKVIVFDNYPAEKVEDLMNLASKGISTSCNSTYIPPPTSSSSSQISVMDQSTVPSNTIPLACAQIQAQKPSQAGFSDLPIMRKASLQRFLEKRKDRVNAKAPYQQVCANKKETVSSNSKKENIEELWFGLGPKV